MAVGSEDKILQIVVGAILRIDGKVVALPIGILLIPHVGLPLPWTPELLSFIRIRQNYRTKIDDIDAKGGNMRQQFFCCGQCAVKREATR